MICCFLNIIFIYNKCNEEMKCFRAKGLLETSISLRDRVKGEEMKCFRIECFLKIFLFLRDKSKDCIHHIFLIFHFDGILLSGGCCCNDEMENV